MKFKAVIFDWDGTLVDMFEQTYQAMNRCLVAMGREPWSREYAETQIGRPDDVLFPELFGDRAEEALAIYRQTHKDLAAASEGKPPPTIEGARELLHSLSQRPDVFIGIVSNKPGNMVRDELKLLGWDHYVHAVVGAGEAPQNKPHAAAMDAILAKSGKPIRPDEVFYVGDSNTDRDFARNSGSKLLIVGHKVRDGIAPDEQCDTLQDIQTRLERVFPAQRSARMPEQQ